MSSPTENTTPKKPSIYDKLTDPSKYTGSHKQRFTEDGKGKGKEGREDIVENTGYVTGFQPDKEKKTSKKEEKSRLTDPKLYPASHKHRFDENGKGKGIDGREDRVELDGYVDGFKKAKESGSLDKPEENSAIYDKLTDPKYYTGSHKERFDEEGKGKGKEGRTDINPVQDLSEVVSRPTASTTTTKSTRSSTAPSKTSTTPKSTSSTSKTTTSRKDSATNLKESNTTSTPKKESTTPTRKDSNTNLASSRKDSSSNLGTPKKEGSTIYDRLTDPKQYTGSHKHRFDEDGKGKGKEGRTDVTKDTGYVQGFKSNSSDQK